MRSGGEARRLRIGACWGKVAAGLLGLALSAGAGTADAQEELFVTSGGSILVFPRTASGVTAPLRSLTVTVTSEVSIALDLVHDELLVTNLHDNSLLVYARTASGNTPPLRTLTGAATGLNNPDGVTLDLVHNELVVINRFDNSILVYPRTATGNTSPLRTLALPGAPRGPVALDLVHDELVVPFFQSVLVYARTASGNALPLRTLTGVEAQLTGVALDLVHDELIVVDTTGYRYDILVYARTASGNAAPLRTFLQPEWAGNPSGVALDLVHDELVVANRGAGFGGSVAVYSRTASGNAAPLRTLQWAPFSMPADSVTLSVDAVAVFVAGLYENALGRAPEPSGLAAWTGFLRQNCNPNGFSTIVQAFFDSQEFRTSRPLTLNGLVTVLYEASLGRAPDPGGLAGWAEVFREDRVSLATGSFIPSAEFQGLVPNRHDPAQVTPVVTRFYTEILGRAPDPGGLAGWVNYIVTTGDLDGAAVAFLTSAEFEARALTFRDYVGILYLAFLGREPDPGGWDGWESLLRANLLEVINGSFVPSPEFQSRIPLVCAS